MQLCPLLMQNIMNFMYPFDLICWKSPQLDSSLIMLDNDLFKTFVVLEYMSFVHSRKMFFFFIWNDCIASKSCFIVDALIIFILPWYIFFQLPEYLEHYASVKTELIITGSRIFILRMANLCAFFAATLYGKLSDVSVTVSAFKFILWFEEKLLFRGSFCFSQYICIWLKLCTEFLISWFDAIHEIHEIWYVPCINNN